MDLQRVRDDADYESRTVSKKKYHQGDRKMINLKQKELSHQLFDHLKQQYPEIDLVDIIESGVYPVNSLGNVSCQKMRIEK